MMLRLYPGESEGQIGPASPKAGRSLCRVGGTRGARRGRRVWNGRLNLFLIWVLPLNKSRLISVPQAPICKMGESDWLISESASCPAFPGKKEEGQWGWSSGKRAVSSSGRGNLAITRELHNSSRNPNQNWSLS